MLLWAAMAIGVAVLPTPGAAATTSALDGALGAYAGPADPSGVHHFDQQIGMTTSWAMDFLDGTTWSTITSPSWFTSHWAHAGYRMVWAVPMLPCRSAPGSHADTCTKSRYTLAEGASGRFDHEFVTLARRLVAAGQGGAVIRLGWELNGNWFPWSVGTNGNAAHNFVLYWRNIVTAMRSVKGASFKFEWNPILGTPVWHAIAPTASYPGDAYVDYIGEDVYDQTSCIDAPVGQCTSAQSRWDWFLREPFGLNWAATFARQHGKQLALPEWGLWPASSDGGGDNQLFITNMIDWIESSGVAIATYFDYGTDRLSEYPKSLKTFRRDLSDAPSTATTGHGTAGAGTVGIVATSTVNDDWSTTASLRLPASCASGDVAYVGVSTYSTATVTAPSGWKTIDDRTETGGVQLGVFRKVLEGQRRSSVTVPLSTHVQVSAALVCLRGVDTASPEGVVGSTESGSGQQVGIGALTMAHAVNYVLAFVASARSGSPKATFSPPLTSVADAAEGTGRTTYTACAIGGASVPAAGATGGYAATYPAANSWLSLAVGVRAA